MELDNKGVQICTRCIYHSGVPNIFFDEDGVCNYCHMHDKMELEYPNNDNNASFDKLCEQIKLSGRGKKYDCVVGVSGGCDSSFLIHKLVEHGVRPLAAHFDNTWNSPIATQNIQKVLGALNIDLYTYVMDNKEFDDIFLSYLKSGVLECDTPTDLGLTTTLYMAAKKYNLEYIVEGHSFRTEGVCPLGWAYMDGKIIKDIHNKFGMLKRKTFPNLTLLKFLRYSVLGKYKRVRPLYFLDYKKEQAKQLLAEKYGWQWYGGHHLENRIAIFGHTYWSPHKHKTDQRILGFSALVRSGQMRREDAIEALSKPVEPNVEIIKLIKKRLKLSDDEYNQIVSSPNRKWSDYKNYKKTMERLKWLFWLLYKFNKVPKSFYIKYVANAL